MAEGTRLKALDESVKHHSAEILTLHSDISEIKTALLQTDGKTTTQFQALTSQFNSVSDQLTQLSGAISQLQLQPAPVPIDNGTTSFTPQARTAAEHTLHTTAKFKLDFPRFEGRDPSAWLHKAAQFFEFNSIPTHHKLQIASYHLDGEALAWWQWFSPRHPNTSWATFTSEIETRFGESPFVDHMATLAKLNQTSTVQVYISSFETHSNRLPELPDSYLLSIFIAGLRPDIRREVQALEPSSIKTAMDLAKLQEEKFNETRKPFTKTPVPYFQRPSPSSLHRLILHISRYCWQWRNTSLHRALPRFPVNRWPQVRRQFVCLTPPWR